MDLEQKIIAIGMGALVPSLLIGLGIVFHKFPDQRRATRMWAVVVPGIVVGLILVVIGRAME